MLRIIILIIAGYLFFKLITGEKKHQVKEDINEKIATGEMVKDPICGCYVSVNSDIRVKDGDKVYCFCSYECRDKYLKMIQDKN